MACLGSRSVSHARAVAAPARSAPPARAGAPYRARRVVVAASKEPHCGPQLGQKLAAAAAAAILVSAPLDPSPALAATTGGRVSNTSGFSSRKAAA